MNAITCDHFNPSLWLSLRGRICILILTFPIPITRFLFLAFSSHALTWCQNQHKQRETKTTGE
jgi:hypothetical protein